MKNRNALAALGHMKGGVPSRQQLAYKLLHEQPHLQYASPAFREAMIIRSIYAVGADIATLANYTGYSRKYVVAVRTKYGKQALRALRSYTKREDYEPTVLESGKNLVNTIKRFFSRKATERKITRYNRRVAAQA
jgi:hypothetical protein